MSKVMDLIKQYESKGEQDKTISIEIPQITLEKDWDEIEEKLAYLLLKSVIFCNNGWWYEEDGKFWPKDSITLHVNCNDVFAWACADSEDITHGEIGELYEFYKKDPDWGPAAWCIKKRKEMPQKPVEKIFIEKGIWDLKELIKNE